MINIFGTWIFAANIIFLSDMNYWGNKACEIEFTNDHRIIIQEHTCNEVGTEIKEKIKHENRKE